MPESFPLEVTCQDVTAKLAAGTTFLFLDCREADEYATAKIAGATLLPMSELADRVAELEPHRDGEIVVHCHHGGRSLRVAMWLRNHGFAKVSSLTVGIDAWSQQIDPNVPRY
jgi:rhodanese-related sulfurtransferase